MTILNHGTTYSTMFVIMTKYAKDVDSPDINWNTTIYLSIISWNQNWFVNNLIFVEKFNDYTVNAFDNAHALIPIKDVHNRDDELKREEEKITKEEVEDASIRED